METVTETILAIELGMLRQTLRTWRCGQANGKYAYPPKLEKDVHWYKVGATIVYTAEGIYEVQRIVAAKAKAKAKNNQSKEA